MNSKVVVLTVVGALMVIGSLVVAAYLMQPQVSPVQLGSSQPAPAFGPGSGRRMMMGNGHAPGGLVAVSPDGKPLAADPSNKLPENTVTQQVGNLSVSIALSPYPPVGFQKSDFDVSLTDEQGQPITDAKISLDLTMPGMWMPPNKLEAQHNGNGRYHAAGMFTMRDLWQIEVIIQRGEEKQSAFFDVWI
jgi:hypothetical protein